VHPIYNLQFLLHRKITVEEPHLRIGPVQCSNCQEYCHTKTCCTLPSVCVACGDLHESGTCPANKHDPNLEKCGNCGENHTSNYRGCPVYKDLKSRMSKRIALARSTNNTQKIWYPKNVWYPPIRFLTFCSPTPKCHSFLQ